MQVCFRVIPGLVVSVGSELSITLSHVLPKFEEKRVNIAGYNACHENTHL